MSLQITVTPGKTFTDGEAVTYEKLNQLAVPVIDSSGSVGSGQIGSSAITEAKIGTGAVTETKIAADAVTLDKIAHATAGDILYWDGSAVPQYLAKGANGEVLTLAAGIPSWAAAASEANIADGGIGLEKLDTDGAPADSVPVYTSGVGVSWVSRAQTQNTQHIYDTQDVYFELAGSDGGSGAVVGQIQNQASMSNSAEGVENVTVTTGNDWSFMKRPTKLWGFSYSLYNGNKDHAIHTGTPAAGDRYFHQYDFTIGDAALLANRGNSDVTVDDTAALTFDMTWSLPWHGAALFQLDYDNAARNKLLWSASRTGGYDAGGTQITASRIAGTSEGDPYKFRLIYWETATTPSAYPYFNFTLTGHQGGATLVV